MRVEIRVQGTIAEHWSEWFHGLDIVQGADHTVLAGNVADQGALYGVLARLRDLGLPLISVTSSQEGENEPHDQ